MDPVRRVVTGLDQDGRSCFVFDDHVDLAIWSTDKTPADNAGAVDTAIGEFSFPTDGTRFLCVDFEPGNPAHMHATDTIDYVAVVSGQITIMMEAGKTVLKAGDVLVNRGHLHAWLNEGDVTCRVMITMAPSLPVGKGATPREARR